MKITTNKKLTVMLDALRESVDEQKIGVFLSNLVRPYVVQRSLHAGYKAMSLDVGHEREANEWIQSDIEVSDTENTWQF